MSQAQPAASPSAGAGGGKKEAVQMAKREKRMKLQKAMECFRKVCTVPLAMHRAFVLHHRHCVQCESLLRRQ